MLTSNSTAEPRIELTVAIEVAGRPVLSVTPESLDFGETVVVDTVYVRNTGTGTLTWQTSEDASWLRSQASGGMTEGEMDRIAVVVDRSNLEPGTYTTVLTIASDGGDRTVSVSMVVPDQGGGNGNGGSSAVTVLAYSNWLESDAFSHTIDDFDWDPQKADIDLSHFPAIAWEGGAVFYLEVNQLNPFTELFELIYGIITLAGENEIYPPVTYGDYFVSGTEPVGGVFIPAPDLVEGITYAVFLSRDIFMPSNAVVLFTYGEGLVKPVAGQYRGLERDR